MQIPPDLQGSPPRVFIIAAGPRENSFVSE